MLRFEHWSAGSPAPRSESGCSSCVRRIGVAARLGLAGAMAAFLAILTIAALGATASVSTAPLHPEVPNVDAVESAGPAEAPPGGTSSGGESGAVGLPGWVEAALVVIAIVVTVFLVFGAARTFPVPKRLRRGLLGRRNRRDAEAVFEDVDVEAAADVFERAASLGDGPDPRAAIIAAYARLLDGLGDVGCARRPHEAPEEHLRRSLVTLGVDAEHMRLVVDKFLVARFSSHPLTHADADGVRSALREVGDAAAFVRPRTRDGDGSADVSDAPRWLRLLTCAALAILLVAVIQPAVGGLLLRTFAIGAALAIGVVGVAVPLHRLVSATAAGGPRARRAPASVPRELDAMAESLRTMQRGDRVPEQVLRPLRASLEHRLRSRHQLTTDRPECDDDIRRRLSGRAYALLTTVPPFSTRPLVVSRDELAALIEEIESL